tara:strand:- start:82 stop:321 length:240 start_codon:yes stop_codon:yes gene_type:complete
MVKRHSGATATSISAAAGIYHRIADRAVAMDLPYNRVQNGDDKQSVRAEYTAMVERISDLEALAIAELEVAVASMSEKR